MAIHASGTPLRFREIIEEFGFPSGKNIGAYRIKQTVSGLENLPLDDEIPQSGTIKFSNFYGKKLNIVVDYTIPNVSTRDTTIFNRYRSDIFSETLHFYSSSPNNEFLSINGYRIENASYFGVYSSPKDQTTPLYRAFYPTSGGHLLTIDKNEYETITAPNAGWSGEGIVGHVYANSVPNSIPIYRSVKSGYDWLYTTSYTEATTASGYIFDSNSTFYALPVSTPRNVYVDAREKYKNGDGVTVIGGFINKPDTVAEKKIWIHTNIIIGSNKSALDVSNQYYCSLLTGSWDPTTDLIVDIGPNGAVYGAGGNGGNGGSSNTIGVSNGGNGGNGTSAIGIIATNNVVVSNRGRIAAGGGGGGGSAGAYGYTHARGYNNDQYCDTAGCGGGGGMGYPAGTGGSPGNSSCYYRCTTYGGNYGGDGSLTASGNGGDGTGGGNTNGEGIAVSGGGGGGGFNGLGGAYKPGSGNGGNNNGGPPQGDAGANGTNSNGGAAGQSRGSGNTSPRSIAGNDATATDPGFNCGSSGSGGANGYAIVTTGGSISITGSGTRDGDILPNTNPV